MHYQPRFLNLIFFSIVLTLKVSAVITEPSNLLISTKTEVLVKKAISLKYQNNFRNKINLSSIYNLQNVVYLSNTKIKSNYITDNKIENNRSVSADTILNAPVFISSEKFIYTSKQRKILTKNNFSSNSITKEVLLRLIGEIHPDINFYNNIVELFGVQRISPLSDFAMNYYNYSLADSTLWQQRKLYKVSFEPKDKQSLTFSGVLYLDSSSLSIAKIETTLSVNTGNTDYLNIIQEFKYSSEKEWVLYNEIYESVLNFQMTENPIRLNPQIRIYQSISSEKNDDKNFANTYEKLNSLQQQIDQTQNTTLFHGFSWLANAVITANIPIGIFDLGKVEYLARWTDIEGLRLTLPLRTNENLWKNLSVGGYAGYGFKNKVLNYSAFSFYRLPFEKRNIIGFSYTSDYRRVDYNYNDFIVRENPLTTGDVDIGGTILALHPVSRLNLRKETELSFQKDWNQNIESGVFVRNNIIYADSSLPFNFNGLSYNKMVQRSLTLSARISFGERTYDKHLMRFYVGNTQPVIYFITELGNYNLGNQSGYYGKLSTMIHHRVDFGIGHWDYLIDAGIIAGNVPYNLLQIPYGRGSGGYNKYQFSLMNYMEYAADKYVTMHNEIVFNGILMNKIPIIKYLNLKEMISIKSFYGTLRNTHTNVLELPASIQSNNMPYTEIGAGFSNIFHLFTLQSVWRISSSPNSGVSNWGLKGSIRINF